LKETTSALTLPARASPAASPRKSTARGVRVSSNDNTIGGTASAARNVIAGFPTGVGLSSGARNKVQGNYVGTDVTGTQSLGNRDTGVGIDGTSDNTIGGTQSGAGNIIAFNGTGVFVHGGNGNAIRRNSIFGNTLGIRYDATSPPIPRAPTPVLTTTGGTLTGAKPNTSYTIEFSLVRLVIPAVLRKAKPLLAIPLR